MNPAIWQKLLRYDPDTGHLFWRYRKRPLFQNENAYKSWNTRFASQRAFTAINMGYHRGAFAGTSYYAAPVIWQIMTGEIPALIVDHENRIKTDDRWNNLRLATFSQNMLNKNIRKDSKTGVTGVSPSGTGFEAKYRGTYLGWYQTIEGASIARQMHLSAPKRGVDKRA